MICPLPAYQNSSTSYLSHPQNTIHFPDLGCPSHPVSERSTASHPHFRRKVVSKANPDQLHTLLSPPVGVPDWKNGKEQPGKLGFAPPFSVLGVSQTFPVLCHAPSLFWAFFHLRNCHSQVCPVPGLQALFSLFPGGGVQFSHYHLKGGIFASIITLLNFSQIIPNPDGKEALYHGSP